MNKAVRDLICDLEWTIGDSVENSQYGETRYPVTVVRKDGSYYKERGFVHDASKEEVESLKYTFGANTLYIGHALVKILDELEERYNLDFNELEKDRKK